MNTKSNSTPKSKLHDNNLRNGGSTHRHKTKKEICPKTEQVQQISDYFLKQVSTTKESLEDSTCNESTMQTQILNPLPIMDSSCNAEGYYSQFNETSSGDESSTNVSKADLRAYINHNRISKKQHQSSSIENNTSVEPTICRHRIKQCQDRSEVNESLGKVSAVMNTSTSSKSDNTPVRSTVHKTTSIEYAQKDPKHKRKIVGSSPSHTSSSTKRQNTLSAEMVRKETRKQDTNKRVPDCQLTPTSVKSATKEGCSPGNPGGRTGQG